MFENLISKLGKNANTKLKNIKKETKKKVLLNINLN